MNKQENPQVTEGHLDEEETTTAGGRPPQRRGSGRVVVGLVLAAALFGGGFAAGSAGADPTESDEYRAMVSQRDGFSAEVSTLEGRVKSLESEAAALEDATSEREAAVEARSAELDGREAALDERQTGLEEREAAVTTAEEEEAANTVGEGTWVVGVDIAAGTYRSDDNVGSDCYWGIYRSGTNGDDILENDIPGGGRPMVTLSEGQDFQTRRCGSWSKQ